ncbi:MAG: M3 family metallopeptidase [Tenuifilaceae bacterium]|jgi:peptidyl-dipeptidase Dcp|nr:M3 family metallopeptidase [Tenuifilaceae bacterium]
MKKLTILPVTLMLLLAACGTQEKNGNPFFSEYDTPFQIPPFEQIDTTHYLPAFEQGIKEQEAEIDAIVNNTNEPTFENTIMALQNSGEVLRKVSSVFYGVNSAETNPTMQRIAREVSPLMTKHGDNISLNEKLFQRIKTLYENKENLGLDELQLRTLTKHYDDFVRNGANLSEADKEKLRNLNQELAKLTLQFNENQLAETNKNFMLVVDKMEDLDGLSSDVISAAAETAKQVGHEGKWVFTLQKPSMLPFLTYAKNRELREKLYRGYFMRGDNNNEFDNKEIWRSVANLRVERAQLLGYSSHAEFVIANNMAKTPEKVYEFLHKVMEPALEASKRDLAEMQKIANKEGANFKLASWDWWFYAEKLRKEKYDLDENEIKPYLLLSNVREGMFHVANQLYGITFTQRTDLPKYHADVETFEVKEADGSPVGILFLDYHPRPGKRSGAWCGSYRRQGYKGDEKIYPLSTIVCNFTAPTAETPALLSWDETETMFHEFGHALHGLFTDGKYSRIAGSVPRDMVELPSQIMEHWAGEPEVLKVYAKHYQTGEPMPDALIEKLSKASTFNQGFATAEYIAAAILDLDWHSLTKPTELDANTFEKESMARINLIPEILPRYRTTYFTHITGGYSAGYYVYLWAGVLDADAFQAFKETGDIYNKEVAAKFRTHILQDGGNDDGMVQYFKFRGQEPSIDALLKVRGLN